MNRPAFKPILNTELPHGFRYIRFERARDHVHPEGDNKTAYIMIAPLDAESRIDAELARKHKDACRVVRRRPDREDDLGHLVHGPGGSWQFHYDLAGSNPDETGSHFFGIRLMLRSSRKPTEIGLANKIWKRHERDHSIHRHTVRPCQRWHRGGRSHEMRNTCVSHRARQGLLANTWACRRRGVGTHRLSGG